MKFRFAILLSIVTITVFGGIFSDQQTDAGTMARKRIIIPAPAGETPLLYPVDFQLRLNAEYRVPSERGKVLRLTGTQGDLYSGALMPKTGKTAN